MLDDDDHPREECGVFGVLCPGASVAHLTYDGLFALQHRGQEAAGMAVADLGSGYLTVVKDVGLVTNVFTDNTLKALQGDLAIGHTRYSTTGASVWANAQPVHRSTADGHHFALAHNGNLTNTEALIERTGTLPGVVTSDSDVLAELVAQHLGAGGLPDALAEVLPGVDGAFSLVFTDGRQIIGARDPHGFRPLCVGRLQDPDGWVVASESAALDIIGATFVRDVEPGEIVVLSESGLRSLHPFPATAIDPKLCVFEMVYFARPDSVLEGHEVHGYRIRMGERLAAEWPLPPPRAANEGCDTMVMGVPESSLPAAEGFARASGLRYGQGLVKNRYIGRTFIAPDQRQRDRGVQRKLNPLRENIRDKRLIVIDDSIVRGTTSRKMVQLLRDAGAAEIHLRIASPPYRWPCYFGLDTGDPDELIASKKSVEEIRDYVGADSLGYLSIEGLLESVRAVDGGGFCTACLTGDYPVEVPVGLGKHLLEKC